MRIIVAKYLDMVVDAFNGVFPTKPQTSSYLGLPVLNTNSNSVVTFLFKPEVAILTTHQGVTFDKRYVK